MKYNRINEAINHLKGIKMDIISTEAFLDGAEEIPCMNPSCDYNECDICNDPEWQIESAYNDLQVLFSAEEVARDILQDAINSAIVGL